MSNEPKSVHFMNAGKRRDGDRIIFDVNVEDLGGAVLYTVHGQYNMKTKECKCSFSSNKALRGLPDKSFEGKDKKCEHYPNGNCEILTEKIIEF